MNELFQNVLNKTKEIFSTLNTTKKIIIGTVFVIVISAFVVLILVSSKKPEVILFSDLSSEQFGKITKKLDEYGVPYSTSHGNTIYVPDGKKEMVNVKLSQDDMLPDGVKGWELFDVEKWTTTDFERNVKYKRALSGAIQKHIESLEKVERAVVDLSMPKAELYIDDVNPYKASITVVLTPGSELTRKEIEGIVALTSHAVDKLKKENVVITDSNGKILNDFDNAEDEMNMRIKFAKEMRKFREKERAIYRMEILNALKKVIGDDKVEITRVNLELNWDQKDIKKELITPIQIKADNPLTPYDESSNVLSVEVSSLEEQEDFRGKGFVPEGVPGPDSELAPGYVEIANQNAKYTKTKKIKNKDTNRVSEVIKKEPFDIKRISVSVMIDGKWHKVYNEKGELQFNIDGTVKRKYIPRKPEEMKQLDNLIKKAIGFDETRGDQVAVENVAFDRSKQWAIEDAKWQRRRQLKTILVSVLAALFLLFIITLIYKVIANELARRRKLREEELAQQSELMREEALREAESSQLAAEVTLEEKARKEMEENAINIARERPEDVAKLIRTWMAEEA